MLCLGGDMNQPTDPSADQAAGDPASKPPEDPDKKNRRIERWLALASGVAAVAAVAAASVSVFQVGVTRQQNTVAEQDQLVALTATIAQTITQQQANINHADGSLTGVARAQAVANLQTATVAQLEVDGEAAAVLISELHGAGVAGIEYVQVAEALDISGHMGQAITFYSDAVSAPPHDAVTRADALRNQGGLYYSLGQDGAGHRDYVEAASVFEGHVQMTQFLRDNSMAQAYLNDADNQLGINGCHVAASDTQAALRALAPLGPGGMNSPNQALMARVTATYKSKCISSA
jgi:hypothetical protein